MASLLYLSGGIAIALGIAVGLFLGYYLDKFFGTRPWLLLVFFILGAVSGFHSLIRGLNKYLDKNKDI